MRSIVPIFCVFIVGCVMPGADRTGVDGTAFDTRARAPHELIEPQRVTYRQAPDRQLSAFIFEPNPSDGKDTAIILFHGGGYFTGSPESTFPVAQAFADAGYTAVPIQYRLADERNTPLEALSDACHALRWVREERRFDHVDDRKVVLFGVSAGAHLAANLVTHGCEEPTSPPAALLLSSASVEVMSFADRFRELMRNRAKPEDHSPLHNMQATLPPTAMAHGEMDRLAPIPAIEQFCERQKELGGQCELLRFADRGHLMSRNLDQQTPGPGFDPDLSDIAESVAFFIGFIESNVV